MPIRVEARVTTVEYRAYYLSDDNTLGEMAQEVLDGYDDLDPFYAVEYLVTVEITDVRHVATHHDDPMLQGEIFGNPPGWTPAEDDPVTPEQQWNRIARSATVEKRN